MMHPLLKSLAIQWGRLYFLFMTLTRELAAKDSPSSIVKRDVLCKAIAACFHLFTMTLLNFADGIWNDKGLGDELAHIHNQVMEQQSDLYKRNMSEYLNNIFKEAKGEEDNAAAVILQRTFRSFLARREHAKKCNVQRQQQRPASQAGPSGRDLTPPVLPGRDGDGTPPTSPERPTNLSTQPSDGGVDPPLSPGNPSTQPGGGTNLPEKKDSADNGNGGDDGGSDVDGMEKGDTDLSAEKSSSGKSKGKGSGSKSNSDKGKGSGSSINKEKLAAIATLHRLDQMNLSSVDVTAIEDHAAALEIQIDELSNEERGSATPACACKEIAILKMAVEMLRNAQQGSIDKEELKTGIDSFFELMGPYGILIDALVQEKENGIKQLRGEQRFTVQGKTLGAALSCMDTASKERTSSHRMPTDSINAIIENAMKATGSSSKTDLANRLRLNHPLRNVLQYLLNFRAMLEVLEYVQLNDIIIGEEEQKIFICLAKKNGQKECTSIECNASEYVFRVILPCAPAHSDLKVRVVRILNEALRNKKNGELKEAYGKAAAFNLTTGQYEGQNNYFEENYDRVKYASTTLLIFLLSEEVDEQIVSLHIVPNKIALLSSVVCSALTAMERATNFILKDQFWDGKFDVDKTNRSRTKLSEEDVMKKVKAICSKSPKDLRGKNILMHVNIKYVQALIRLRDICRL